MPFIFVQHFLAIIQLRLFERMKCRVDPTDKAFKCYRLECIQNQILRTKILPAEIRVFKDQGENIFKLIAQ